MTAEASAPAWLIPGARVAVYSNGRGLADSARVKFTVVDRIGKRDVVLQNGDRFNVRSLNRNLGTWSGTEYLRPADDPDVQRASAHLRRRAAQRTAEAALKEWIATGDDSHAEAAIDAIREAKSLPRD
jgi:hypothetical protein